MNKILVADIEVKISNLDKVFWPKHGFTKGDMINYYIEVYPLIKNYLKDRPLSLKIYPDGINGKSFYQKNAPDYAPDWLTIIPIYSSHRKEAINWVMVNKLQDLIWVANSASIELHGWFSTTRDLERPNFAVFDLDPGINTGFEDTIEIALLIKKILDELKLISFIKTSGKSGLHIYIPLRPVYKYEKVKGFLKAIAEMVIKLKPELATIEWRKRERQGKIYIDYRQNSRSKTIPAPYSLRPTENATISTPLEWEELSAGIKPEDFTLANIKDRLDEKGDLWSDLLKIHQKLPGFLLYLLFFLLFTGLNTGL
ncbi:MAG: bifunctional non-ous end joining protein LigD [Halanaerobiales bacterium]|nr:bifunctional non-ous end joining protein LigD [Halanaerobiales bacterium]